MSALETGPQSRMYRQRTSSASPELAVLQSATCKALGKLHVYRFLETQLNPACQNYPQALPNQNLPRKEQTQLAVTSMQTAGPNLPTVQTTETPTNSVRPAPDILKEDGNSKKAVGKGTRAGEPEATLIISAIGRMLYMCKQSSPRL